MNGKERVQEWIFEKKESEQRFIFSSVSYQRLTGSEPKIYELLQMSTNKQVKIPKCERMWWKVYLRKEKSLIEEKQKLKKKLIEISEIHSGVYE